MAAAPSAEAAEADAKASFKALDYRTGKVRWRHALTEAAPGSLTTAGDLLFGGDGSGNFVAYDPSTAILSGTPGSGEPVKCAITFMLDGRQFVVVGAGDSLYAFAAGPVTRSASAADLIYRRSRVQSGLCGSREASPALLISCELSSAQTQRRNQEPGAKP